MEGGEKGFSFSLLHSLRILNDWRDGAIVRNNDQIRNITKYNQVILQNLEP